MSERFEYPFNENYLNIDGVRLHYLDEGEGPVIWMMHGMPMWSYVYRNLIPPLVRAGYRCFVPDLMGFGLSDKPDNEAAHSVQRHVELMSKLIEQLALKEITIVGQDWGGPIALRYAIENRGNIAGIVLLNTFIERFPENKAER
ncbi:MAG: alpha/beta fold hydrolase, partial [Gammaproteobacteria bacterium]